MVKKFNLLKMIRRELGLFCKKKCGFLMMASKVGGRETFQLKTLVGHHRCGMVFGNKNANSD